MKLYAIVVAAGKGTRMNSSIPKQFMMLEGKPLFTYCIECMMATFPAIEVLLVVPVGMIIDKNELTKHFSSSDQLHIVEGGSSRFQSVKNALDYINDDGIVFIHDAVRPFITKDFLHFLLKSIENKGNAIPYTELNESIRRIEGDTSFSVERSKYKAIQTPQVFTTKILRSAYGQQENVKFTDDASVVDSIGESINLVKGLDENIKITRAIDMQFASLYLKGK